MKRNLFLSGAILALAFGMASGAANSGKPADLPMVPQVECVGDDDPVEGKLKLEFGFSSKGITLKVETDFMKAPPTNNIDVVCPAVLQACLEQLYQQVSQVFNGAGPGRNAGILLPGSKALEYFEEAERHYSLGDYRAARASYQQVHQTAPTSLLGRLAIQRLQEVEERLRDAAEEQIAPPPPQEVFRDMLDGSVPLGLVEIAY